MLVNIVNKTHGQLLMSEAPKYQYCSNNLVFVSHHPRKIPWPNYPLFFDKHQGRVII